MNKSTPNDHTRSSSLRLWDERTGPEMFWLSILSLILLAGMFHINNRPNHLAVFNGCLLGFLGLYPAYWVDCFWAVRLGSRDGGYHWLYAIFPPLRIGAKDHETNHRIWLPGLGWQTIGFELERRIQQGLQVPMIVMSLLILPLLGTEYFFSARIGDDYQFAALTAAASGIIWSAFAAEFILMATISQNKIDYCREHILELIIILLPILGMLGTVQIGRELRINQITKAANLYRLRGLGVRFWQSLLMFDFVNRLLSGPPPKQLKRLKVLSEKKRDELQQLEARIQRLESQFFPSAAEAQIAPDSRRAA